MEIKDYVEEWEKKLEVGIERQYPLSELYDHFKEGTFTPKGVLEFYRQRDSPRFLEAVKKFEGGKLFLSQMQSYESWMHHDYAKEDKQTAEKYLSVEDSAQQKHEGIRAFIFFMVYGRRPGHNESPEQAQKSRDRWVEEVNRNNWRWNK